MDRSLQSVQDKILLAIDQIELELVDVAEIKPKSVYWYRDRGEEVEKQVEVVRIDHGKHRPTVIIRVDGREVETEGHRLFPRQVP